VVERAAVEDKSVGLERGLGIRPAEVGLSIVEVVVEAPEAERTAGVEAPPLSHGLAGETLRGPTSIKPYLLIIFGLRASST